MQKVKEYFKDYPESLAVYATADGFLFHKQCDAQSHASTLKDKKVTPFQRPETAEVQPASGETMGDTGKPAAAKAPVKKAAPKKSEQANAEDKTPEATQGKQPQEQTGQEEKQTQQ